MSRIQDALQQYKDLLDILMADCMAASLQFAEGHTPFARRTVVRTVFALVDGATFSMKQYVLAVHAEGGIPLTEGAIALLKEETYDVDDAGRVKARTKFVNLKPNVRFTFKRFAKACLSTHEVDAGGKGWQAFRDAVEIRNRLVHPKVASEMEVSNLDMLTINDGVKWFQRETAKIMSTARRHVSAT